MSEQECEHVWTEWREQFVLGGTFRCGWHCELCGRYVSQGDIGPAGVGGRVSSRVRLHGAHGGYIDTASGRKCKTQVYDRETGEVTYA